MTMHTRRSRWWLSAFLLAGVAACGGGEAGEGAGEAGGGAATQTTPSASGGEGASFAFTAADVDAYERGLKREIEVVRAAQQRASTARTPQERGDAMQAQWAEQTMPEGAKAAGVPADRYRQIRESVDRVLQTLDFQGKIEGPLSMDTARATPDMRRKLASDPLAELPPASAEALRARLDRLAPVWAEYKRLTAVAG